MKANPLDFWEKYELINSTNTIAPATKKVNICRYCGKNENETTFNQKTHLLPELLGENNLLSPDECDNCNKLFCDYESHLSIFLRPYTTLMGIKGKKKVPTFQSRSVERNESTRTILKHVEGRQKQLIIQNIEDYRINKEEKKFEITFRQPPFIPLKIYKALLKIGLSLLPVQYDNYNAHCFEWLVNKREAIPFFNYAFMTTLQRKYFKKAVAELYRAKKFVNKNSELPEHTLILSFANINIQIFLPFTDELMSIHNGKRNLDLNLFPAFIFDSTKEKKATIKYYDLSVNEPILNDNKIVFTYEQGHFSDDTPPLTL